MRHVGIGRDEARHGVARFSHVEQRTRLWISLTKEQEVKGPIFRQNDQIRLHEAHCQTWRRAGNSSRSRCHSNVLARCVSQVSHGYPFTIVSISTRGLM